MANHGSSRGLRLTPVFYRLLALICVALVTAAQAHAAPEAETMTDGARPSFWIQLFENLFNSRELMRILGQPEYAFVALVALNLIVFVETGLLFGFFLPGDSLLVTAGVVCSMSGWNLPLLLVTLSLAAIIGDTVGYGIGWHTGPKIFCREKSFFFNKDHLLTAQKFYERHGGKTIILARFMPFIRTFAPVVAGVGSMRYRTFLVFNICGGVGWVASMILFGYYLRDMANVPLKSLFGPHFDVQDHIDMVVILVVLLSVAPIAIAWLRQRRNKACDPQAPTSVPRAQPENAAPELAEAGQ
jgi:membrane-associated protein